MSGKFELASAVFALIAAGFWFWSASGEVPPLRMYWDRAPDDDPFKVAIEKGVKLNRIAALFSGLSALAAYLAFAVN